MKAKKNKKLFYIHTIFFFLILSCFHSPFSVSLFTASPSLLSSSTNPQTLLSSSQTITDLHEPSCHRSIAADPCLAVDLTHFDLSSLFLAFRLCVSSCVYVLALCFGLCLCFSFFFRDGFMFRAMIFLLFFFSSSLVLMGMVGLYLCFSVDFSAFFFLFFFTGFDGHDGVVFVQWFLWVWWWLWLWVGGWMKYYFIVVLILFYCVKN